MYTWVTKSDLLILSQVVWFKTFLYSPLSSGGGGMKSQKLIISFIFLASPIQLF